MLYIIKSYTKTGHIYKVGYAKNINNRYSQYNSHNPTCELISSRDGEIEEETKLHLYLSHKGFRYHKLNEWYVGKDDVLSLFHQDMRNIDKYLWKYRDEIFKKEDFRIYPDREILNKKIYEKLFNKYSKNLKIITDFDSTLGTSSKINCKNIDIIYYSNWIEDKKIILYESDSDEIINFFNQFEILSTFKDSLKFFCECQFSSDEIRKLVLFRIPREYQNYYYILGSDRCKALGYQKSKLDNEIEMMSNKKSDTILSTILNTFQIQQRYTLKEIKEKLGEIYSSLNISKTPKASDLEEYFEVKKVLLYDSNTKKRDSGLEIIKIK